MQNLFLSFSIYLVSYVFLFLVAFSILLAHFCHFACVICSSFLVSLIFNDELLTQCSKLFSKTCDWNRLSARFGLLNFFFFAFSHSLSMCNVALRIPSLRFSGSLLGANSKSTRTRSSNLRVKVQTLREVGEII